MATAQAPPVVRYVRRIAAHLAADLPDPQLLERFARHRDEAAFAALVRRHGPLVLAACRRVLRDGHAAEDAFQCTFVVLARKSGSLRRPEALGPWLYGVATRTALKLKAGAARRREVERRAAVGPAVAPPDDEVIWRDLRPILDEAVARLPERFRAPFLLHHLQGLTVAEVARRLGCPPGTVAARLARAKEQLRAHLSRRGLVLSAAALAARSEGAAAAGVPAPLLVSTVMAAAEVAAGRAVPAGSVPAQVAALLKGGLTAMPLRKIQVAAALALLAGGVGLGVTARVHGARGTGSAEATPTAPSGAAPVKPAAPAGGVARVGPVYVIEPPDVLLVRGSEKVCLPGHPLDGPRLVRPDGTVGLGVYGHVSVAGMTVQQATAAIAGQLKKAGAARHLSAEQVGREVMVQVQACNSKAYYVLTDLGGQGEQVYRFPAGGDETILDAIARIDGLPAVAGQCRLWVERGDRAGARSRVLPVDWEGLTRRGEARTNYVLRPGDRVHVKAEGAADRPRTGEVDRALRRAFGDDCQEALRAPVKLELRSRRLVLAAGRCTVEADGRLKLAPCWLAWGSGEGGLAVRCREALLTFDGPVRGLADVGRRRLTAVEPSGEVRITPPPDPAPKE